jgi:Flp pilus assembly CpaF family ATPase
VTEVVVPVTVPPVNVTAPVFTLKTLNCIPLTRLVEGNVMTVADAEFIAMVVPARMSATVTV